MKKTYIFGHKKPDTDAVASAITLSYLKNKLGFNTEARVLGNINKESIYALKYFNVKEPRYLNDVKLQLRDINYHKGFYIYENESIYEGYQAMIREQLTGIPICEVDGTFSGFVSLNDLSHSIVNENVESLYTSFENILYVLKGESLVKCDDEITGRIIVASYRSTTFMNSIRLEKSDILIVGDRHSVIEYAIDSHVKCIILTNDSYIKEEHIEKAKLYGVNIIRTPYDAYRVSKLVALSNYIKTMLTNRTPTLFQENDYITDIVDINSKKKHTNYPVIDKKNRCIGMLKVTDLSEKKPKQVILVDHNEKLQSVDGIEEAEILEIIDHHAIGNITTANPINYRSMVIGSTSTIIYNMYKDSKVDIPKDMAGLMLSGILSDTLILKSPTTTEVDIEAVENLARIAEVDYQEYGLNLLKAGTSLDGMTPEDVLYNDYKIFSVNDKKFSIGQFFTMNFTEIRKDLATYIDILDKVAEGNNYSLVALYVTDIVRNGSYVIYNTKAQNIMDLAYSEDVEEAFFVPGCISRKKHVVPVIMDILEG